MKLISNKKGFTLSHKNRILLSHTEDSPAVFAGTGEGHYKFNYGLFKIRDRNLQLKSCRDYSIGESSGDMVRITFECGFILTFREIQDRIHMETEQTNKELNRFKLILKASEKEHIYGCGEQYSKLDLRGQKLPIWVQEPGLGRGKDLITLIAELKQGYGGNAFTTYFSQPTFISSDNWYFHSEGTAYCEFDFRKKNEHSLLFWQLPEKLVIGVEKNAVQALSSLSAYLGRQRKPPEWVYDGMWIGMQGGRDVTSSKLQDALDAGVKTAAIWCQDWEGIRITSFGKQLFWDWKPNEELYPDFKGYMKELNSKGIRYLGYINPFLALEGPLYAEAREKNYCVKNDKGEDYYVYITTFPAAMVDLTNPAAVKWIKEVIKKDMIGKGLSGWMADFGEYVPADAVLHSGVDPQLYHNQYAADWARINYEAVEEAGKENEITYFMRAGYTGSSRYSAMNWNGDQLVNWSRDQGFATVIPGTISMGFSGIGYTHSDLGGYTTLLWLKRSKELFMRWAELSAFTQTMRTHEGNRPDSNWQFNSDGETLSHLARMTDIYVKLKPYHLTLSDEYQKSGIPPVRHPYIHYEKDKVVHKLKYQYMYGRDLMVAPVISKGKEKWKVYLPTDKWVHLWSGKDFRGGWSTVECPIGQPPVFYRKSSEYSSLFQDVGQC
ncbi:alpha-glucosidase [Spirochaeta isovalerica]|uniref:Alpha-glucosidase n=1 Tax=Spirochaeta isovalerica TaxID=150 RepID=A0A841RIE8_9SPIO|nr:alpha-glucosidase [Spirochaeta isovalerica]MBB6482519.1 alpha-glucosidase [Spirochaeta isovalerica]